MWGVKQRKNGSFQGKTSKKIRPDKACHISTAR
jgi:hypothetical protein